MTKKSVGGNLEKKAPKDVRSSVRWNQKTLVYLNRLGYIDLRTGRTPRGSNKNLSSFINQAVVLLCESDKNPEKEVANGDELRHAWRRYQISLLNSKISKFQQELLRINGE